MCGENLERVISVDQIAGEPVARGTVGYSAGNLLVGRHRDGVLVVLDDAYQRQLVNPRPVHGLVPVTLGGRALSPVDDGDGSVPLILSPVGDTRRVGELCTNDRRLGEHPLVGIGSVTGELTTTGGGVVSLGEQPEENFDRGEPPGETYTHVAVRGEHPVPRLV